MATWVELAKAMTFPEVIKVYKKADRGQGTGQGTPLSPNPNSTMPTSAPRGFLATVRIAVQGQNPDQPLVGHPLPGWIRVPPGLTSTPSWQDYQVDVTNIPGVRPLRKDGKCIRGPQ
jgi:hypothetical protein